MSCLGDHSELDGACEVERRDGEHGQDLDEVRVAHREELEVALRGEELGLGSGSGLGLGLGLGVGLGLGKG